MTLVALKSGSFSPDSATLLPVASAIVLREFEFLPDPVVFETYWRQSSPKLVHQMETWRGEVGGACDADEYFIACRRALYLRNTLLKSPRARRHLHAVGPSAVLCVWLLRRLEASGTASFQLSSRLGGGVGMAGSTLRKLAPVFTGGWLVGERKLAASLGPNFRPDPPDGSAWVQALAQWSASSGGSAP